MTPSYTGLSIHQCVYCGAFRDDEIDALLCAACATKLAAGHGGLTALVHVTEEAEPVSAAPPVLVGFH